VGRGIRGRQERQDKEDSVEPLVHPVFPDNQEALSGREFMELLEQLDPSAFQDQQVIINIVIIIIILFARIQVNKVNTAVKLYNMKKRSERRKHCALAVVGGAKKIRPTADPLPGAHDGQNLISWRRSLHAPTDLVW